MVTPGKLDPLGMPVEAGEGGRLRGLGPARPAAGGISLTTVSCRSR